MKFSKITIKNFFLKDEKAVKEVYNETYRLLFYIAFSYLHQKEDAEDIVSETYRKMLNLNEINQNIDNFLSYMIKICKNLSLDFLKKRNINNLEFKEDIKGTNDLYKSDLLRLVLKILTEEEYNIFMYRAYFELSFKEISSLLNKTESRCRGIYFEARLKLKNKKELFL